MAIPSAHPEIMICLSDKSQMRHMQTRFRLRKYIYCIEVLSLQHMSRLKNEVPRQICVCALKAHGGSVLICHMNSQISSPVKTMEWILQLLLIWILWADCEFICTRKYPE